jgi:putative glycosyltransferase
MRLSVVATLYHSAPYLPEFYRRVSAAASQLSDNYELILVNDGSPDDSLQVALALQTQDTRIKVVDLSRNFGHHPAMLTGLRYATGELVFLIDSDLEEEPELLQRFDAIRRETGADVVFGVQDVRRGGRLERATAWLYYKVVNALARDPLPRNVTTVRLMSRRFVDALLQHTEVEVNIAGLWARTGFHQVPVTVAKKHKGSSTYNLPRKLALLVNAITSMSGQPLVLIFYLGLFISALAFIAAMVLVIRQLFFGAMLEGWPSLIVSIWLLGGLMIFCQGVLGLYLAKVLMEAKRRPIALVRAVYDQAGSPGSNGSGHAADSQETAPARVDVAGPPGR